MVRMHAVCVMLALVAATASAQKVVVDTGCTDTVTPEQLGLGYFGILDVAGKKVVGEETFTFGSIAAGSDAVCKQILITPCTSSFTVTRYEDNTVTAKPGVAARVGPAPGCAVSNCQGGVGELTGNTITGQFFKRGTDNADFDFTSEQTGEGKIMMTVMVTAPIKATCKVEYTGSPDKIHAVFNTKPVKPLAVSPAVARSPVVPSPQIPTSPQPTGNCTLYAGAGDAKAKMDGVGMKPCSRCQWACLTDLACSSMEFNGKSVDKKELAAFDCAAVGDAHFTLYSPGLCVLYGEGDVIIDAQEQDEASCDQQCKHWPTCKRYSYVGSKAKPPAVAPQGRRLMA